MTPPHFPTCPSPTNLLLYIFESSHLKLKHLLLLLPPLPLSVKFWLEMALLLLSMMVMSMSGLSWGRPSWRGGATLLGGGGSYCLSWRLAVEANDVGAWRTVPSQCMLHIEAYVKGGQYEQDVRIITDQIFNYINGIAPSGDGKDAWIFDVDDTCISNVDYYKGKRYGCDGYDPAAFKAWALKQACPAIAAVRELFGRLVEKGFKVFLITGRDEETLFEATSSNLQSQGFLGYENLIMRAETFRGLNAVAYKSQVRKELAEQGYRIWGNVGDQWSDLQGQFLGNRTFKLPNPMYFVP